MSLKIEWKLHQNLLMIEREKENSVHADLIFLQNGFTKGFFLKKGTVHA